VRNKGQKIKCPATCGHVQQPIERGGTKNKGREKRSKITFSRGVGQGEKREKTREACRVEKNPQNPAKNSPKRTDPGQWNSGGDELAKGKRE